MSRSRPASCAGLWGFEGRLSGSALLISMLQRNRPCFRRRPQRIQILSIESAKRGCNCAAKPNNAALNVLSKKRHPHMPAESDRRVADSRRAAGMGDAITR